MSDPTSGHHFSKIFVLLDCVRPWLQRVESLIWCTGLVVVAPGFSCPKAYGNLVP